MAGSETILRSFDSRQRWIKEELRKGHGSVGEGSPTLLCDPLTTIRGCDPAKGSASLGAVKERSLRLAR